MNLPTGSIVLPLADGFVHRIVTARKFLMGEIASALGDSKKIEIAPIRDDSPWSWIAASSQHVDRDGNGQLDERELNSFVELLS